MPGTVELTVGTWDLGGSKKLLNEASLEWLVGSAHEVSIWFLQGVADVSVVEGWVCGSNWEVVGGGHGDGGVCILYRRERYKRLAVAMPNNMQGERGVGRLFRWHKVGRVRLTVSLFDSVSGRGVSAACVSVRGLKRGFTDAKLTSREQQIAQYTAFVEWAERVLTDTAGWDEVVLVAGGWKQALSMVYPGWLLPLTAKAKFGMTGLRMVFAHVEARQITGSDDVVANTRSGYLEMRNRRLVQVPFADGGKPVYVIRYAVQPRKIL